MAKKSKGSGSKKTYKRRAGAKILPFKPRDTSPLVVTESSESKANQFIKTAAQTKTKANEHVVYLPDWEHELTTLRGYVAVGGKEHGYALWHYDDLIKATDTKYTDLDQRHRHVQSISPERQKGLAYLNPFSKLIWLEGAMKSFEVLAPTGPLHAVTLIHEMGERTTEDDGNGYHDLKELVERILAENKANAFGHIEYAVWAKQKIRKGYRGSVHAQFLIWGTELKKLKAALKKNFPKRDDGVLGYVVKELTDDFQHALSYATKAPTYGYRAWPTELALKPKKEVPKDPLPDKCQRQLLQQFYKFTWPDACIAVGEGTNIMRGAIHLTGYKPRKAKSPQTDKAEAVGGASQSAEPTVSDPTKLTLGTKLPAKLQVKSDISLEKLAQTAATDLAKYADHEQKGEGLFVDAMNKAYVLALTSWGRADEVEKLAERSNVTFNKGSDLMHLSLKVVAKKLEDEHKKVVDKRRISEGARALRYLYWKGCKSDQVLAKLDEFRGVRKCSEALAQVEADNEMTSNVAVAGDSWATLKKHGRKSTITGPNRFNLSGKHILFAVRNKEKNKLLIPHRIKVSEKIADGFLKKVANDLTKAKKAKKKIKSKKLPGKKPSK